MKVSTNGPSVKLITAANPTKTMTRMKRASLINDLFITILHQDDRIAINFKSRPGTDYEILKLKRWW